MISVASFRRTITAFVVVALLATGLFSAKSHAMAADGAAIYQEHCSACHQTGGIGAAGLAPPLVSPHVKAAADKQPNYAALVVLNGLSGPLPMANGEQFTGLMPPVGLALSDADIAAVVCYVYSLNDAPSTAAPDASSVAALRPTKPAAKELRSMRQGLLTP